MERGALLIGTPVQALALTAQHVLGPWLSCFPALESRWARWLKALTLEASTGSSAHHLGDLRRLLPIFSRTETNPEQRQ